MTIISLVEWQLTPGEPFRIPARHVVPCVDFWHHPVHVVESADKSDPYWLFTLNARPANHLLVTPHWAYEAAPGDENVWDDDGHTHRSRYVGLYTPWGLHPADWATGELTFAPTVEVTL